jgi:hypothetical protein
MHLPPSQPVAPSHHANHTDLGQIALEQRVRCLRRRMRDKRDVRRCDIRLAQQSLDPAYDAGSDAVLCIVTRRHLDLRDDRARRSVDRDDVGERSADVDS